MITQIHQNVEIVKPKEFVLKLCLGIKAREYSLKFCVNRFRSMLHTNRYAGFECKYLRSFSLILSNHFIKTEIEHFCTRIKLESFILQN